MLSVKFYSYYRPFVADSDDMLAEVINWVCLLVFVGTLAAYMEALEGALGLFPVLVNVFCFGLIVWLIYRDINREHATLNFAYAQARQVSRLSFTRPSSHGAKGDADRAEADARPETEVEVVGETLEPEDDARATAALVADGGAAFAGDAI